MRPLISKLALFFLPLMFGAIILELLVRNIPNNYSYKRKYLDKNSNEVQVLYLGSSHTYRGLNPHFSRYHGFNAAYVSQPLEYDLEILRKYSWDNLDFIVVSISYASLFKKLATSPGAWRIKNYNLYYHLYNSDKLTNYAEILSMDPKFNIKRVISYYIRKNSNLTCTKLGYGSFIRDGKGEQVADLAATGILAAKKHTERSNTYFDENLNYLKSIIEFAEEKHAQVIMYTPPAHRSYTLNLDKVQLNRTINTVREISDRYPNAFYTNFLEDPMFNESCFYDADHLNETGAEKLTSSMDSILHSISQSATLSLTNQ